MIENIDLVVMRYSFEGFSLYGISCTIGFRDNYQASFVVYDEEDFGRKLDCNEIMCGMKKKLEGKIMEDKFIIRGLEGYKLEKDKIYSFFRGKANEKINKTREGL